MTSAMALAMTRGGVGDDKGEGVGDDSLDASGYASGLVSGSRFLNFPNSPDAIIRAMI